MDQEYQGIVGDKKVVTFAQDKDVRLKGKFENAEGRKNVNSGNRVIAENPMNAGVRVGISSGNPTTTVSNSPDSNVKGILSSSHSGMIAGISGIKRSCEDKQLSVEEQRQKILKTIANQSLIAFRSDDSDTEVGSSPDSTSEYSSESTVKYVGTAGSSKTLLPIASTVPKPVGNPNPSYQLGFVSNGCSKVNYLGSVIGVETDDENSVSSSKSPSVEHSVSPVIPSIEDSSRRLFPPPPAPVSYQSGPIYYATYHSTSQAAEINPTFQFPVAAVGHSALSTGDSLQSARMKIFSNTSFSSRLRSVDQSDMNLYYEQMKDKVQMPTDFYDCSAKQVVNAIDPDPQSSEDTSLQEDSDTDTIVYSPSKGTEDVDHAVCESRDTAQLAEGETGEGISSIPYDTTGSKSWSTQPSGTIGSPSGVTDGTQPALRETCSTFQGVGADTGEGISSIPSDIQDSNKSKSQSLAMSASTSTSASSSTKTSGEPWMARVAIAQKFRIICGGLASMTHLGNINALAANADEDSDETESEEMSKPREGSICRLRTFSNDETIDEEIGSIQSEEAAGNEAELFKDDDDEVSGGVLPYQQMVQITSPPYNPSASFLSDYPQFSNQTFMAENALYLSPQSMLENYCQITSPQSLEDVTVFYQPTVTSDMVPVKKNDEQVTQVPKTSTTLDGMGSPRKTVSHSSRSSKLGQMSHEPDKTDNPVTSSESTVESSSDDKHASWEPKINKAITSRINILEELVYRCLENEDAALYEMESVEEEGAAAPVPSLSRTGSSSRVDVSRTELRNLISDLEGIVSSMNERSRTLSADNVAKFFEKTASVVGDHGSSSSSSVHSKEEAVDLKEASFSGKSLRSHSMIEIEKALSEEEGSSSGRESVADVFQPDDQIHIKPSILKRIDHLEEIMSRCLENEDVTMNTLGSGILSPSSSQKEVPQEQHHTSKVELKDLIGDLGSLVSNLGQRFNPDNL
ncbi:serine-rich adhesin for platelets-like [Palaemon carinicauda]|uniref:serine-rich adhesin for platelets-like n=1 Tax=Palaemon carinicauda TaxID=392227 RepID=UPI0035B65539